MTIALVHMGARKEIGDLVIYVVHDDAGNLESIEAAPRSELKGRTAVECAEPALPGRAWVPVTIRGGGPTEVRYVSVPS
jgi:hypothetical protein